MIQVFVLDEKGSKECVASVITSPPIKASNFVVGGYTRDPSILGLRDASSGSSSAPKKFILSASDEKEKKRLTGFAGYLQGRGKAGVVKREGSVIYLLPAKAGEKINTIQCVVIARSDKPKPHDTFETLSDTNPNPEPSADTQGKTPRPSGLLGSLVSKTSRTDGARMMLQNKKAQEERNQTVDYISRMEKELQVKLKDFSEDPEQTVLRLEPMDKDYRYVVHDITGQFENLLSASCGEMDERHVVIYKKGGKVPEGVEIYVNKGDLVAASAKAARKSEAASRRADAAQFQGVDFSMLQSMSTKVNTNKRDRRSIEELEAEVKERKMKRPE